jgi:release factor glutamine methyltransferase
VGVDEVTEMQRDEIARALAAAGCISPLEEADALLAAESDGVGPVDRLVDRRVAGEPLAWITGSVRFCDLPIAVEPGVFVPRPHTEPLARRAAQLLPPNGRAVDLCTGSGAVAAVLRAARPAAEVLATDVDPIACACARRNGVTALQGDLDSSLPREWHGSVDVMTAVTPYVPSEELHVLPRDVLAHEPRAALDGGPGGLEFLGRVVARAPTWLRPAGHLLLELGGEQAEAVEAALGEHGFETRVVHRDEEGQDRAIEGRLGA